MNIFCGGTIAYDGGKFHVDLAFCLYGMTNIFVILLKVNIFSYYTMMIVSMLTNMHSTRVICAQNYHCDECGVLIIQVVIETINSCATSDTCIERTLICSDWALEYLGSIILRNTTNITIPLYNFTDSLVILYFCEQVTINNKELQRIAAIALWGQIRGFHFTLCGQPYTMGVYTKDANNNTNTNTSFAGTNPHDICIIQNYCHAAGIFEKQSAFYFQAKSHSNLLACDIFYNEARADITFNDGFGGGSNI